MLITNVQTVDYVLMELMVTRATVLRALLDQAARIVSKGLIFTIVYSFYDFKSKRPLCNFSRMYLTLPWASNHGDQVHAR